MNLHSSTDYVSRYTTLADAGAILVTGSTGFLGAYILCDLAGATKAQIYCLVRAENDAEGRDRIYRNLEFHSLEAEEIIGRVRIICGDVAEPRLGLNDDDWRLLSSKIDVVIHGAARISWLDSYKILAPTNVDGTRNILKFVREGQPKTLHFVSTTGIYMSLDVPELGYLSKGQPLAKYHRHVIGYFKSKWVAEQEVHTAFAAGLAGSVYRPSFLIGPMNSGYIPQGDLTRSFLTACLEVGAVPDLKLFVDAVPVNVVARAIINVASSERQNGRAYNLSLLDKFALHHLSELSLEPVVDFELLSFDDWQQRLRISPMTEAKRAMILFGWPVPGAPEGLLRLFSKAHIDPVDIDLDDALDGSGMEFSAHVFEFVEQFIAGIINDHT